MTIWIFILVFLLLALLIFWPFKFTLYFGQNFTSLYGNFVVEFFGFNIKTSRYQVQLEGINFIKKKKEVFVDYGRLSEGSEFFERFSLHVYRGIDFKELYYHYNLNAEDLFTQVLTQGSFYALAGAVKGVADKKLSCPAYAKMTLRQEEDNFLRARCIIRLSIADIILAFFKSILGGKHGQHQPD